jgi:hypothetical protein
VARSSGGDGTHVLNCGCGPATVARAGNALGRRADAHRVDHARPLAREIDERQGIDGSHFARLAGLAAGGGGDEGGLPVRGKGDRRRGPLETHRRCDLAPARHFAVAEFE